MRGGLSLTRKGHVQLITGGLYLIEKENPKLIKDSDKYPNHTILDFLYHFSKYSLDKKEFIHYALLQLNFIQKAWENVVKGYIEIKRSAFK